MYYIPIVTDFSWVGNENRTEAYIQKGTKSVI